MQLPSRMVLTVVFRDHVCTEGPECHRSGHCVRSTFQHIRPTLSLLSLRLRNLCWPPPPRPVSGPSLCCTWSSDWAPPPVPHPLRPFPPPPLPLFLLPLSVSLPFFRLPFRFSPQPAPALPFPDLSVPLDLFKDRSFILRQFYQPFKAQPSTKEKQNWVSPPSLASLTVLCFHRSTWALFVFCCLFTWQLKIPVNLSFRTRGAIRFH